ncbi:hypothetical protein BDV27DRAFT_129163 [Aspergillus caelatus]|uniref:Uncharacterized protein n=1 Tax=Aspergillus caelatus TaxID=61420 RepID=A0A5N7A2P1_9EURO|nr:uncharacterized protein BDV27DRAFT_129163 [Aspergillus caelatus]KAE8363965.1 hypothetical protein BDV27DRAFT_129163 [Aspergillus caelatus]
MGKRKNRKRKEAIHRYFTETDISKKRKRFTLRSCCILIVISCYTPSRIYNDESIQQKRKKTHENKKGLSPA